MKADTTFLHGSKKPLNNGSESKNLEDSALLSYTPTAFKWKSVASMAGKQSAVETLTFESALDELQNIVKNLETGKTALEDSIAAYERGIALKNHCEKKLSEARSKIEKISVGADGKVSTAPFEQE